MAPKTPGITKVSSLFGRIALHNKLLTSEQLRECLEIKHHYGADKKLGEILVDKGYLTRGNIRAILDTQNKYLGGSGTMDIPDTPPVEEPQLDEETRVGTRVRKNLPTYDVNPLEGDFYRRLLTEAVELGASDLHLQTGARPYLRLHGEIVYLDLPVLEKFSNERRLMALLEPEQRGRFLVDHNLDFSFELPGVSRFRANYLLQFRGMDGVFRVIPKNVPTPLQLGLPEQLRKFTKYHQGLVLVTGPAGCGKSTTLAALVNVINTERKEHIITIEDPIEYVFPSRRCLVNQREAGRDTISFSRALRAALREDPDIIMVGEMRDHETVSLAITAAETGHLVFGTLHTSNAVSTIDRVIDAFPPDHQAQVRVTVSESLRGVICQQLVRRADGTGRVPAFEILFTTPAVSNLIRENRTYQMRSLMQAGRKLGQKMMDQSLRELVQEGIVTAVEAERVLDAPGAAW